MKTFMLLTLMAAPTLAQTLMVTTVQDTVDSSDGVLSLREAIIAANANVDSSGRCRGITNIHFSLSGTNAVATYGTTSVPYYKIRINYLDPEYAGLMSIPPVPTPLPHVRCPINLDGYTQPGVRDGAPRIELSGEDLAVNFAATPNSVRGEEAERTTELLTLDGRLARQPAAGPTLVGCRSDDAGCPLRRSADGSVIRGIMFNHAPQTGLQLAGVENVTVTGNYFGLDATGENPAPNGRRTTDVRLFSLLINAASNNIIGTPKERNYFGTARSHAIMMWPHTAIDGSGSCAAESAAGVSCSRTDIGSSDNVIQSNYFGLNTDGTRSVGGVCIAFGGDRRFIGEGGCQAGATESSAIYTSGGPQIYVFYYYNGLTPSAITLRRNRIGGMAPHEGNVFAAAWTGITVRGLDTEILGNVFGLDATGMRASEIGPFFRQGIVIQTDSAGTLIQGNIITNSVNFNNINNVPNVPRYGAGGGIFIVAGTATGSGYTDDLAPQIIRGNHIGVNTLRRHPGNNLLGLPATNAGGGLSSAWMLPTVIEGNVIAYNGYLGLPAIAARSQTVNQVVYPARSLVVLGNSMYCNGAAAEGETCGKGLGIDWLASTVPPAPPVIGDGPTLNDDGDMDDGPARLQNYPVLSADGNEVTVRLGSEPNTTYRIQLFSSAQDSSTCVEIKTTLQPGFEPNPACAGGPPAFFAIQGETLLGEIDVTTDANGIAGFTTRTPANRLIAATATRLGEDGEPQATSEMSQAVWTGKE